MKKQIWLVALVAFTAGAALASILLAPGRDGSGEAAADPHAGHAMGPDAAPGSSTATTPDGVRVRYQCPMHPTVVSDAPGECPICGMRMVPIEEPGAGHAMESHAGDTAASPTVAGYTTISVPERKQQFIGVKTRPVERRVLSHAVEAVARVDYDESRLSWVNTRVGGWIEDLHVDRTGELVRKGDPVLEIYSPDLVSAQEEYLVSLRNLERLESAGALGTAVAQARALVEGSRERLALWDIPEPQIRALEERGTITRRMTIEAPVTGFVLEKTALLGKHVAAGENLYQIADLSTVWVMAEIYEYQAPLIRKGQEVLIRVSYEPGRSFHGRVDYVYPYLDPATRTIRVRIVAPNPGLTLRPEMYASVTFRVEEAQPELVVPNEAILDTGERLIAFVRRDEGTFEPRELRAGLRTREFTIVLEGLEEGEDVVTSGNFLIDSESRLKAALEGMSAGAPGHRHGG